MSDGTWTSENYSKTESSDDVHFKPGHVNGVLCMRFYEAHSSVPLAGEACTRQDPIIPIPLATGVSRGTNFFIKARQLDNGSSKDFDGWISH